MSVHVAVLRANASASPDASAGAITRREAQIGRRSPLRRLGGLRNTNGAMQVVSARNATMNSRLRIIPGRLTGRMIARSASLSIDMEGTIHMGIIE